MNVTLALGGGGARGLAHLGVMRVLEREGFEVRGVAGTSIGGVIAAGYAMGRTVEELSVWAEKAMRRGLFQARPREASMLGIDRIRGVLEELLGEATFDRLARPLAVTATNLETGHEIVLTEGRVMDAVMATIALPGIFPPQLLGSDRLVDGGLIDPVPVRAARSLFPGPVVAVSLSPPPEEWAQAAPSNPLGNLPAFAVVDRLRAGQALRIFMRALEISARTFSELRLKVDRPDVVVRPRVSSVALFDTPSVELMRGVGEAAMLEKLADLRACFGLRGTLRRLVS
jgi:NTE family protein